MKNRARALAAIFAVLLIGCLLGMAGYHFWGRDLPEALGYFQFTTGSRSRWKIGRPASVDERAESAAQRDSGRFKTPDRCRQERIRIKNANNSRADK